MALKLKSVRNYLLMVVSVALGLLAAAKVVGAIYIYALGESEKESVWYLKQTVYAAVFIVVAIKAWWLGSDGLEEIKDEQE